MKNLPKLTTYASLRVQVVDAYLPAPDQLAAPRGDP
jgi:hypothetical protein